MADASPGLSWLLPVSCAVGRARGRELGEPQAAASLSSGSSAREMPTATGHLSPAGSWVSPLVCAHSVPPPYPSSVPSHCSFSSQKQPGEPATGPAAPGPGTGTGGHLHLAPLR